MTAFRRIISDHLDLCRRRLGILDSPLKEYAVLYRLHRPARRSWMRVAKGCSRIVPTTFAPPETSLTSDRDRRMFLQQYHEAPNRSYGGSARTPRLKWLRVRTRTTHSGRRNRFGDSRRGAARRVEPNGCSRGDYFPVTAGTRRQRSSNLWPPISPIMCHTSPSMLHWSETFIPRSWLKGGPKPCVIDSV